MQVSFFQELCGNTFNYLKAAHKAHGNGDTNTEKVQLEEAYTDFLQAARVETTQRAANGVRAITQGQDKQLVTYITAQTMEMYGRMSRKELPHLPPLRGENGMWSLPFDPSYVPRLSAEDIENFLNSLDAN